MGIVPRIITRIISICAILQLVSCSTFQSATFSEPSVEAKAAPQFPYGDGIAFKLSDICVAVREGLDGADYRNNFAGPLIFTFFPLEIFSPERRVDFYEIELDLVPFWQAVPITLEPRKATLKLRDGTLLYPYEYRVWHFFSRPGPFKASDELTEPVVLRATNTNVKLRYKKRNELGQIGEFHLGGLYHGDRPIDIPTVTFGPRTTHYRFVFSGRTKEIIPMSLPIVERCHQ